MHSIEFYRNEFIAYQEKVLLPVMPTNLYDPMIYIMGLGGKRLRPVLTLIATEIFGESYKKGLHAALAIEVFHNFSLVHDDIMDGAPLRRGKKTVHEKWNINTGILSGDVMLIKAYQFLEAYDTVLFKDLVALFSETAVAVCEGQQYDIEFETRTDVTVAQYLKMIAYKTSVLLGAALKMGALIAGASVKDQQTIYNFGENLGIAFQLQDDYLDAYGDPQTFGKQVGGDIIANKKTFLYLQAMAMGNSAQKQELAHLFSKGSNDNTTKIQAVKSLYTATGASKRIRAEMKSYTDKAFQLLELLDIDLEKKQLLQRIGESLVQRNV
ncbi:polyprenyl synthetase family protein [Arenibacter sp. GZD96]|uniref:polyprenyl synthetase family protein n=1 Tax=Aurantibrevibacter litoralis TaxID=3106030 RepID=UPI002AFFC6AD|nr:polyprenyl synthetase family protein [Arenibacter sp. GZD-96]MEA1786419.1 polyprenyl synthetase family protein [Arenibacter sp. GZD-96]